MESISRIVRIEELGEIITGSTPPTNNREYYGSKAPLIKATDMTLGHRYIGKTEESLSDLGVKKFDKKLVPKNTPCIVTIGTIGKSCLTTETSLVNQAVNCIVVDSKKYNFMYVYYLMLQTIPTVKLLNSGTASGRENVSKAAFSSLEVTVVKDLKVQEKIGNALSIFDSLIENNRRRIAILEEMTQSLYREWFVKFRYPGHENQKLVESPLGLIPEGWGVKRLDDFLVLQRGFDLPKQNRDSNGDIPIYAASGFSGFHNEVKAKAPGIVTGRSGTLGIVTLILDDFWPLNTSLWIKEFKNCSAFYAYYLLQGLNLERFNSGSSVPTLNRNDVHGHEVISPPLYLIKEFEIFSEGCHRSIKNLRNKNENLKSQRDMLLPKLISGQIDLSEEGNE